MNETAAELNYEQLEDRMNASAVLMLREMHETQDLVRHHELFEQAADQEASLISEVLDGAVVTDFTFHTKDGRLHLLQPNGVTDWQEMHELGVLRAEAKAAHNKDFEPYVRISKAELEESRRQEAIVKKGRPAVMVKLSMCGDDVLGVETLKELGRSPEKQRAFLRVAVFDGTDLHIHYRSIDCLRLDDGRGIADGWGTWEHPQMDLPPNASSVDILENEIYFDEVQMSVGEMHELADKLVDAFDDLQTKRTGQVYKAGRAPEGVDTYRFVLNNHDLLNAHLSSLVDLSARAELPIGHVAAVANNLRFDIISSFKQRLEGTWIEYGTLGESVAQAGNFERALGTQYGGCDIVINAGTAEQAGYTNAQAGGIVERARMIKPLREKVVSRGSCSACGAEGKLFGCGLCGSCNKKWCDIFELTGKQTPIKNLAKYKPKKSEGLFGKPESFDEYWARLGKESQLKKLQEEARLTDAA